MRPCFDFHLNPRKDYVELDLEFGARFRVRVRFVEGEDQNLI